MSSFLEVLGWRERDYLISFSSFWSDPQTLWTVAFPLSTHTLYTLVLNILIKRKNIKWYPLSTMVLKTKKYHNVFATPAFKVLHLCHLPFSQAGCDCISQSIWHKWHYVTSGVRSQVMGFHVVSWRVCSWNLLLRIQPMCEKPKTHGEATCGFSAQPSQQSPAFKPSNPCARCVWGIFQMVPLSSLRSCQPTQCFQVRIQTSLLCSRQFPDP